MHRLDVQLRFQDWKQRIQRWSCLSPIDTIIYCKCIQEAAEAKPTILCKGRVDKLELEDPCYIEIGDYVPQHRRDSVLSHLCSRSCKRIQWFSIDEWWVWPILKSHLWQTHGRYRRDRLETKTNRAKHQTGGQEAQRSFDRSNLNSVYWDLSISPFSHWWTLLIQLCTTIWLKHEFT